MFPLTRVPYWVPIFDPQPDLFDRAVFKSVPRDRALGIGEIPLDLFPWRWRLQAEAGTGSGTYRARVERKSARKVSDCLLFFFLLVWKSEESDLSSSAGSSPRRRVCESVYIFVKTCPRKNWRHFC